MFVDIDPVSLNLDPEAVEAAVTSATKAVITVHYAGVGTGIDRIVEICRRHGLILIEDAAHAIGATFEGKPLGSFGAMATVSFHETKNVISGEGGALVLNDPTLIARAEIISDKGTDRARFERGETQKYVWQDLGSSYRASEVIAAFLLAQLEERDRIRDQRLAAWNRYHAALENLERTGRLIRPVCPQACGINGHIYYVLLPDEAQRRRLIDGLKERGIQAVFHYVPLHDSPAGRRFGRAHGSMIHTNSIASRILRLPIHLSLSAEIGDRVTGAIAAVLDE